MDTSPTSAQDLTGKKTDHYDQWFRAKIKASHDDPRPSIPHDRAMSRIRKKLNEKLRVR